jgi:hypothetical protein
MDNTNTKSDVTMCDGDLRAWIEQETIHLKATDKYGDPIELSWEEARIFAQQLLSLADKVKD